VASPGYFEVLGRERLAGRLLEEGDANATRSGVVVNRTFAERFLDENAVGSILPGFADGSEFEVVGVVEDVRPGRTSETQHPEIVTAAARGEGLELTWLSLLVRTREDPEAFVPVLRALLEEQDPAAVPDRVRTMEALLGDSLSQPRLYSLLVAGFAACALGIAGVGLFGPLSHSVALRRREIGLRIALGARPADVVRLVAGRALLLAGLGLVLGLVASLAAGRALEGLLFGVRPHDPLSLAAVTGVLLLVALLAALLPARRAAATLPQEALRQG
jgi:putative ABC transport system permease protein